MHASPRVHSAAPDYHRRPQTPEYQSRYDQQHRPDGRSAAGSPQGPAYSTPELRRYGTPHEYAPRGPPADDGRLPAPPSRPTSIPPRSAMEHSSRPSADPYYAPPRRDERGPPPYDYAAADRGRQQPMQPYDDRYLSERERMERAELMERDRLERDRMERERVAMIERDRADRDRIERDRAERDRMERDRVERDRLERDRAERDRMERDRVERDRMERERAMMDRDRQQQRIEFDRIDSNLELRMDRERMMDREREAAEFRDRERFDRMRAGPPRPDEYGSQQPPPQARQQQQPSPYATRQPEAGPAPPRESSHWSRPPYDAPRSSYDQPPPPHHQQRPPPQEYPPTTASPYPTYASRPEDRYAPPRPSQTGPPPPPSVYDSPERNRVPSILHPQPQQGLPPPNDRGRLEAGPPSHLQGYNSNGGGGNTSSSGLPPLYEPSHGRPPPQQQHQHQQQQQSQVSGSGPQQPHQSQHHEEHQSGPGTAAPAQSSGPQATQAHQQQRNLLAIQELNRSKGRVSPLPQAVQGARSQSHPLLGGPGGEPGIKSEFGRMFSGIGGGVSSPIAPGPAQLPFSSSQQQQAGTGAGAGGAVAGTSASVVTKREDGADTLGVGPAHARDDAVGSSGSYHQTSGAGISQAVAAGSGGARSSEDARFPRDQQIPSPQQQQMMLLTQQSAKLKRRKLKEDGTVSEDASGRATPTGSRKRVKTHTHHHHHQYVSVRSMPCDEFFYFLRYETSLLTISISPHHHHHLPDAVPSPTALSAVPGRVSTPLQSPSLPRANQALDGTAASTAPGPIVIPKPVIVVSSQAVFDAVADRPRHHLGDVPYEVRLEPTGTVHETDRPLPAHGQGGSTAGRLGFRSTPVPLPWSRIEGKENCTITVKVDRCHLTPDAREEITVRRAVWGTDIYTDDSDVVAACIHQGWFRGEWPESVDAELLLNLLKSEGGKGTGSDGKTDGGKRNGVDASEDEEAALLAAAATDESVVLTHPPKSGPMKVPEDRDLHVTLLILPTLEYYASTTRFGLRSRAWGPAPMRPSSGGLTNRPITVITNGHGHYHNHHHNDYYNRRLSSPDSVASPTHVNGVGAASSPRHPDHGGNRFAADARHDGLSFAILSIRWVASGGGVVSRLRGKGRRERMRRNAAELDRFMGGVGVGSSRDKTGAKDSKESLLERMDREWGLAIGKAGIQEVRRNLQRTPEELAAWRRARERKRKGLSGGAGAAGARGRAVKAEAEETGSEGVSKNVRKAGSDGDKENDEPGGQRDGMEEGGEAADVTVGPDDDDVAAAPATDGDTTLEMADASEAAAPVPALEPEVKADETAGQAVVSAGDKDGDVDMSNAAATEGEEKPDTTASTAAGPVQAAAPDKAETATQDVEMADAAAAGEGDSRVKEADADKEPALPPVVNGGEAVADAKTTEPAAAPASDGAAVAEKGVKEPTTVATDDVKAGVEGEEVKEASAADPADKNTAAGEDEKKVAEESTEPPTEEEKPAAADKETVPETIEPKEDTSGTAAAAEGEIKTDVKPDAAEKAEDNEAKA